MGLSRALTILLPCFAASAFAACHSAPHQETKSNVLVIWGDDIGQLNISAYARGMMVTGPGNLFQAL